MPPDVEGGAHKEETRWKELTVSRVGRDDRVGKDNEVRQGRNVPLLEDSSQTLSHSSQDSKRYLKVKTHI